MIRSILVPLTEGPVGANGREMAFWLARSDQAAIHALAVIDIKVFEIPVMATPDGFMPSVVTPPIRENQSLLAEMTDSAKQHLEQFARQCAVAGIPCSTAIKTGMPVDLITREAVGHDLIVMGRAGYNRIPPSQEKTDPLVSHVIHRSVRPVVVTGAKARPPEIRNILVAYDGSAHAGRALLTAVELGTRAGISTGLIAVAPTQESGLETLAPAEEYLLRHGVRAQKNVVLGSKASDVICGLVADILIMGSYGHTPIREVLFGSTTARVLSHCDTTVVLHS